MAGVLLGLIIFFTVKEPRTQEANLTPAARHSIKQVLAFLWRERAVFLPHMFGFSFMAGTLYAVLGWSPAYLMRTFDLSASESGLRLGIAALTAGICGVYGAGWFMDRLTMAGRRDAPFLTGIVGSVGAVVPIALLPFVESVNVATTLLAAAMFFASTPMPPSTAVMQILPPPAMRGRVSAIFLFLNSFAGLALGTAVVGILNDQLFVTSDGVAMSLATFVACASIMAVFLLNLGRKPFAARTEVS